MRRRPPRRARPAQLVGLAVGIAAAAAAAQPQPVCFAEASVEPARAVVGEQVLYRVRIFSSDALDSVEWSYQPSFPHLRTEVLPGDPQPLTAADLGELRARDERRALFAERPGVHRLRAPELRCRARHGAEVTAAVPEVVLRVDPLPEAGRPPEFDGLVGPLASHVSVTPRSLALGESLRVAVMLRGGGNLWVLASPFDADAFGSAEVFAERPQLLLERGRALFLRRHFAFDVVPREPGVLKVPALAIAYYDPAAGRYRVARSNPVAVAVGPRAEHETGRPQRAVGGDHAPSLSRLHAWWWAPPLAGLALLALALRLRRRGPSDDRVAAALAEAAACEATGDASALAACLARALREALVARVADARSATPEELIARPGLAPAVAAAAHLLVSVERARFDPETPLPDPTAVRRAIAEL